MRKHSGGLLSMLVFGVAVVGVTPAFAQKADSGKFLLTIKGASLGTDTFKADADGGSTFDIEISIAGQKAAVHGVMKAKAGAITSIDYEAKPGGKYAIVANGAKSTVSVNGAKPKPAKLADKIYPFDNYAPHLLSSMFRAYDKKKGGVQKIETLLLNNGSPFKVEVTLKGTKTQKAGGKLTPVTTYVLSIAGGAGVVEINVSVDADNRVLMWHVPSQAYKAYREGYKDLAMADEMNDPLLSKPTHEVLVESKVKIAMRDGVNLIADVYRPKEAGNYPVILQRTPYGRKKAIEADYYARRGYVFVAQDVRGKFESEGVFEPFVNEAQDGFDSVEWCGKQSWSNGSVGMIGGSYLGFVQWAAAREGSSYLKCIIPIVSPPDPFFNIPYAYGAVFLYPSLWWASIVKDKEMNAPRPLRNIDKFYTLPLNKVDSAVFGKPIPFFQKWLKNSSNNSYWDRVNFNSRMKDFKPLPALHISGWFDGDGIGTKLNYAGMIAAGQQNQRLVYGAWQHAVNSSTRLAELDFGSQSSYDLDRLYLRWFDHFLKGIENKVEQEPPVEAFLMGRNEWRKFSAWPPQEATMQKWYLHSGGKANGATGDGKLSTNPPTKEPADRYVYDPAKPVVPHALTNELKQGKEPASLDSTQDMLGEDRLVYTSEALKQDVVVAGPISAHIQAATSAKDTDWYACVCDVYPNGKSIVLVQGIIRARFRTSFEKPTLVTPNAVNGYDIDLWALGNVFQKGHKIRIMIASSFFPLYDRNLNTGEDIATGTRMVKAKQTLFHDAGRESYLLLPVLPK